MQAKLKLDLPPPFDEALRLYEREIMRYIFRTVGERDDALDLFQETWLRAYRAYQQVDCAAGVRPWLYRIASNLCLNRRRDRMRRSRVMADDEINDDRYGAPLSTHDGVMDLKSAIAGLPAKQRQALTMRKFGGLEYAEIASALGCSEEAARAGVYQALKKIKAAEDL